MPFAALMGGPDPVSSFVSFFERLTMPSRLLALRLFVVVALCPALLAVVPAVRAEGPWETTPESEAALKRGLDWLARNQGPEGNWESNDLGLVALGSLAFLSAGHMPGRGEYGETVSRSLNYVLSHAKPSGLLNMADAQRDMYNHGLSTFVLGQAHGMAADPRLGTALDQALRLTYATQAEDGGWNYQAVRRERGNDLSLAVMQAKAIRSAVDGGLEVPPAVVRQAIRSVRGYYKPNNGDRDQDGPKHREGPGQFTYDGNKATLAMAAAGVVCLQEFGQYDDWRIPKNMAVIRDEVGRWKPGNRSDGRLPADPYTLYYVGQAAYQVGGDDWKVLYPTLRDRLVETQFRRAGETLEEGHWSDTKWLGGKPAKLYGTAVACFILAMPNRYLPILQEGRIEGLGEGVGE